MPLPILSQTSADLWLIPSEETFSTVKGVLILKENNQ